jgi:hypothetical protein
MSLRNGNGVSILPVVVLLCALRVPVSCQPPVVLPAAGEVTSPKQAYMLLQMLAGDSLGLQDSIGRKRAWIADGVLHYDLRPEAPTNLSSRPDCFSLPLEILIRSAALGRDLATTLPNQKFWTQPLENIEMLAMNMVQVAYQTTDEEQCLARQRSFAGQAQTEFQNLESGLNAYAAKAGLSTLGTRGVPNGYKVQIKIDPPRARIRIMPFLDYKRCQYFSLPLEDHWNDLPEGNRDLIGRYHYRAEWPPSLNGPEEGNFDIHENGAITFRPKSN